jgi:hypothetical protein
MDDSMIKIEDDYDEIVGEARFLTQHGDRSLFSFERTNEPGLMTLRIFDKDEFWKESIFIVIEKVDP